MIDSITDSLIHTLSPTITNMIRLDHTSVLETFHQFEMDSSARAKKAVVDTVCLALDIHTRLEEEIFYPAMRAATGDGSAVTRLAPEHDEIRRLIATLHSLDAGSLAYDQTFMELMRTVMHHVADEETMLLPQAETILGDRLAELGAQMTRRRMELTAAHAREIAVNAARGFPASTMLIAAGAVIAGTYLARRAFEVPGRGRRH